MRHPQVFSGQKHYFLHAAGQYEQIIVRNWGAAWFYHRQLIWIFWEDRPGGILSFEDPIQEICWEKPERILVGTDTRFYQLQAATGDLQEISGIAVPLLVPRWINADMVLALLPSSAGRAWRFEDGLPLPLPERAVGLVGGAVGDAAGVAAHVERPRPAAPPHAEPAARERRGPQRVSGAAGAAAAAPPVVSLPPQRRTQHPTHLSHTHETKTAKTSKPQRSPHHSPLHRP